VPALARAREQGKRAVCLNYQKQLATSWLMYADDNSDKIVNGDTEEYGQWNEYCATCGGECTIAGGGFHYQEKPWILIDYQQPPCWPAGTAWNLEAKKGQLRKGALFKFIKDVKVLKCPRGNADEVRTYSIVDSMNVLHTVGPFAAVATNGGIVVKSRLQIRKTTERFIFIENGGALQAGSGGSQGGWSAHVKQDKWWDVPSIRHGDGTTFSFVDGHAEYHKWTDPTTLDDAAHPPADGNFQLRPGNKDIRWTQKGVWGDVAGTGNGTG
jgi:prepilin-type processing-associated H-X9-DG protein